MNALLHLPEFFGVTVLAGLLVAACWHDVRSHRIPNLLVLYGMVAGVACQVLSASTSVSVALSAAWVALTGIATGLAMLLPLYVVRSMGAGDVKLMAMVGSFLGPLQTVEATLMALVAVGVLAVVVAAARGTLAAAAANVWTIARGACQPSRSVVAVGMPASRSAGKLPYALAIAAGTMIQELLARGGHSLFA